MWGACWEGENTKNVTIHISKYQSWFSEKYPIETFENCLPPFKPIHTHRFTQTET